MQTCPSDGNQPQRPNKHRPSLLVAFGGAIFGGVAGGILGGVGLMLMVANQQGMDEVPGAGIGIILALFFGLVIGAVIGAGIGALVTGWLSTRPSGRSVGVALAIVGCMVGLVVVYKICSFWSGVNSETAQLTASADAYKRQQSQYTAPSPPSSSSTSPVPNGPTVPPSVAPSGQPSADTTPASTSAQSGGDQQQPASPAPVETITAAQLASAYGDLVYPDAVLVPSYKPSPRPDVPCALETMSSSNQYAQVVGYYQSRLTPITILETEYIGSTHRASDGRLTFIRVHMVGGMVYIDMSAS